MKEKDKPGAPPPSSPEKPKPVNDDAVSFAYNQLIFHDYFIIDNRRYVRFFVEGEKPFYIDTFYGEFIEYQLAVWELKNKLVEEKAECSCDRCIPPYEKTDEVEINVIVIDANTEETTEINETMPVYFVYSLSENIKCGNLCKTK